jgi:metal-responsive CopG/Arc/MetJ family transcriptional regulator
VKWAVKSHRFSLSLPKDLADWLEREAVKQGRTRSNLIRWILEQYRRKAKSVENEEVKQAE